MTIESFPMSCPFSKPQIIALSPDDASLKAAQRLLSSNQWAMLEADGQAAWGQCKGSGARPYQVQVDLTEPAFKCSCPSRKFPCKHGLALLLVYAEQESVFTLGAPQPIWVNEWLTSRRARIEKSQERATEKLLDVKAQAKRQAHRMAAVSAGLDDFELWLRDLLRRGLIVQGQERPVSYWQQAAARLVDAKAPGMANYVRRLSRTHRLGAAQAERMVATAGLAYLACSAAKRLDALTPAAQADLQTVLGWTTQTATVLAEGQAVRDLWRVVGIATVDFGQLRQQRIWLQSAAGRPALLLNHAVAKQAFDLTLAVGTQCMAELTYYPGSSPLRAVLKARLGDAAPLTGLHAAPTFEVALDAFATAVAANPWLEQWLLVVESVRPHRTATAWQLIDVENKILPIADTFRYPWDLLAVSGGHPITVVGEWQNGALLPLLCSSSAGFQLFPHDETDYWEF
jgi:hypothetical protein